MGIFVANGLSIKLASAANLIPVNAYATEHKCQRASMRLYMAGFAKSRI